MKKILAILLVCCFAFTFVACTGGEEESSTAFQNSEVDDASGEAESVNDDSSEADESTESSEATSEDASTEASEGDTSEGETSEGDTSEGDEPAEVVFTNKYVSWKVATGNGARTPDVLKADDAAAIKISKFNDVLGAGDVGVFTSEYGKTINGFASATEDFAVVVAEYDHKSFSYVRKSFSEVGKADESTKIPEDGFVVVIHKDYTDKINGISTTANPLFPHGFYSNDGLDAKIRAAKTAPVLDGTISGSEYGSDPIWVIEPKNELVSYAQFEENNYFATAEVYAAYDADNFYLAVVVDSSVHENPCTLSDCNSMWKYTCIQVNIGTYGRDTDYISENWDHGINNKASSEGNMIQYGFGVNAESGETLYTSWMPSGDIGIDTCKVVRNGEQTIYEVAIPWNALGTEDDPFAPKKGDEIAFSVSFNLGGPNSEFKNITLRDGGGIIGINDWTKIPTITLA